MATQQASFHGWENHSIGGSRFWGIIGVLVSVLMFSCANAPSASSKAPSEKGKTPAAGPSQQPSMGPSNSLPAGQVSGEPMKAIEQGRQIFRYDTFGDEDF